MGIEMVELVLAYALYSNEPMFLREEGPPYANFEVALDVHKDFSNGIYLELYPYLIGEDRENVGRAGAYLSVGYELIDNVKLEFYHHSAHNLDNHGHKVEVNGIRMRWRLF